MEYKHYAQDPDIGNIENSNWRIYTMAILLHEMAHAIQYTTIHASNHQIKDVINKHSANPIAYENGHGEFYQAIYRILRKAFLNGKEPFLGKKYDVQTLLAPKRRSSKLVKTSIGIVDIKRGSYRNNLVRGVFTLLKDWTVGKTSVYIVVELNGRPIRVTFKKYPSDFNDRENYYTYCSR